MPLSTPLQLTDRGTGEVLKACLDEHWDVALLREVAAKCKLHIQASTSDRAGANSRCIHGKAAYASVPALSEPCCAHMVSTAQQRAFASIGPELSGIIASSLAMKPGNALNLFRQEIE
eukprot:1471139-Heterocapsa_arctica.AAC.1